MKKRSLSIIMIILILFLSSASIFANDSELPVYKANISSSVLKDAELNKKDGVLIFCDPTDYMIQRKIETGLANFLEESGVNAEAYSDINIISNPSSLEELFQCAINNKYRYIYYFSFMNFYNNNTGIGIRRVLIDSLLADLKINNTIFRVAGSYDCEKYAYQSYSACLEPLTDCILQSLETEFSKLIKNNNE